jgi:hypothetical protein
MAQRKKRGAARKATLKRGRAPKRAARTRMAKRVAAKTAAKKRMTKTDVGSTPSARAAALVSRAVNELLAAFRQRAVTDYGDTMRLPERRVNRIIGI